MRRIAVVTSTQWSRGHPDDVSLFVAMPRFGLQPEPRVWSDPNVPWERHDAILVRTPWDYFRRWPEFSAWLDRIGSLDVPVINPVPLLRWNADKRYLLALEAAGVAVVPTRFVEAGRIMPALEACGWRDLVVKPTVSGGAWDTLRLKPAEFAARAAELELLARKHTLMLQPYLPEVETDGEWSLVYFGSEFSHAVRKRPRAGDFRVQEKHGGGHERAEPGVELVAQGRAVLAALPGLGFDTCLYARVDGVVSGGRLLLMELEVLEPQLFLAGAPHAGASFARLLSSYLVQRAAATE